MGFRITDREIDRKIRIKALSDPVPIEIVRKGGLPQQAAPSGTVAAPRTIIDAYLSPTENPLGRQYLAELAGVERVRLSSQSNVPVYVLYSESTESNALDPGDYAVLEDDVGNPVTASQAFSDPGDDLRWFTLPAEVRTLVRLLISTSQTEPELDAGALDGRFSVALQADV